MLRVERGRVEKARWVPLDEFALSLPARAVFRMERGSGRVSDGVSGEACAIARPYGS
ncbi:hypothetical protein PTKU64_92440 (plasmid) [Paraburkholderia terrae]|uniref:NUDIX hydrolase n=1 Tax=Paraburkholderia terrae TaxID=311230 RepID=A0ABM7UC43_9BURK|nr:hypothetical protein PTKU64_92440 [Paraburkholderia terrae]